MPRMSRTVRSYSAFDRRRICDVPGTPGVQLAAPAPAPPRPVGVLPPAPDPIELPDPVPIAPPALFAAPPTLPVQPASNNVAATAVHLVVHLVPAPMTHIGSRSRRLLRGDVQKSRPMRGGGPYSDVRNTVLPKALLPAEIFWTICPDAFTSRISLAIPYVPSVLPFGRRWTSPPARTAGPPAYSQTD